MLGVLAAGTEAEAQQPPNANVTRDNTSSEQQMSAERLVRRKLGQFNDEEKVALGHQLSERVDQLTATMNVTRGAIDDAAKRKRPIDPALHAQVAASQVAIASTQTAIAVLNDSAAPIPEPDRVFEQIVTTTNPSLPVCGKTVSWTGDQLYWQQTIATFFQDDSAAVDAVGRVEEQRRSFIQKNGSFQEIYTNTPIGTAFVIRADLVVTAEHVVHNRYKTDGSLVDGEKLQINFGAEYNCAASAASPTVNVLGVPAVDVMADLAILRVQPVTATPFPVSAGDDLHPHEPVVVIGYPGQDKSASRDLVMTVMRVDAKPDHVEFDIKRFQPGEILPNPPCSGVPPDNLGHDASTLGNNSGSPIIRVKDKSVVGVQNSGRELVCNYATVGSKLTTLVSTIH
jgi:Trypsin-like peptidase domain